MGTKKNQMIIGIAVVAVVAAAYFLFLSPSVVMKPKDITVDGQSMKVPDPFGVEIKTDNIKEVVLKDSIPKIGMKVNGAGIGNKRNGKYEVEGMGTGQLYIESDKGPYIIITTKGGTPAFVIINFEDSNKTQELYNKITSVIK